MMKEYYMDITMEQFKKELKFMDYEELKKVFGGAGYSFAQGSRMTFDYILSEIADGNIEIRESGFRKTLSARVGR